MNDLYNIKKYYIMQAFIWLNGNYFYCKLSDRIFLICLVNICYIIPAKLYRAKLVIPASQGPHLSEAYKKRKNLYAK